MPMPGDMSNPSLGNEGRTLNLQLRWPGLFSVELPIIDKITITSVATGFIKYSNLHG